MRWGEAVPACACFSCSPLAFVGPVSVARVFVAYVGSLSACLSSRVRRYVSRCQCALKTLPKGHCRRPRGRPAPGGGAQGAVERPHVLEEDMVVLDTNRRQGGKPKGPTGAQASGSTPYSDTPPI